MGCSRQDSPTSTMHHGHWLHWLASRKQGLREEAQYGNKDLNDIQMNIDNAFHNVEARLCRLQC